MTCDEDHYLEGGACLDLHIIDDAISDCGTKSATDDHFQFCSSCTATNIPLYSTGICMASADFNTAFTEVDKCLSYYIHDNGDFSNKCIRCETLYAVKSDGTCGHYLNDCDVQYANFAIAIDEKLIKVKNYCHINTVAQTNSNCKVHSIIANETAIPSDVDNTFMDFDSCIECNDGY